MISKKTITAALGALFVCLASNADVFSDAATWHQGFYGSGNLASGSKTAFPDKLRAGDSENNYHTSTVCAYQSGVKLETDTVVYPNPYPPYTTLLSRSETVAYVPQEYDSSSEKYNYSCIKLVNPFAITNTAEMTFFVRLKWNGVIKKDYARFLLAGHYWTVTTGFELGINSNGKVQLYSKTGATSNSSYVTSQTALFLPNVWTDFAVVISNSIVKLYTLSPGSAMKYEQLTTSFGKQNAANAYRDVIQLGGELEAKGTWPSTENVDVFPGYFHAFASWSRALSEDEIKQVFAYPMTADLVRLGTKNGSSLEFKGATLGGAESGSATEDWAKIAPSLTAGTPSQSIPFTVPANFAGVSQVLRVAFAPNSASGKVNVSVGGTVVGELEVKPGKSDLLTIKGDLLTSGAKTLTLTRDASSGDIVFDALAFGGGFNVGKKDNKNDELTANSSTTLFGNYYAYSTNVVLTQVWKDLPAHNSNNYTKQYFHVYVPDEIASSEECKILFKSNVSNRSPGHTFALSVNGSEVARKVCDTANVDNANWCAFECEVPATALVPGENEFIFANVTGGSYAWLHIDYYSFETIYKKKFGFAIIFR